MSNLSVRILYWAPRLLAIAFIAFISLFSLDVFNEKLGPLETMQALFVHLLPSIALTLLLILAWKREWIGAIFFGLAGAYYLWLIVPRENLSASTRWNWSVTIAGPALLIALLFWASWLMRNQERRPG